MTQMVMTVKGMAAAKYCGRVPVVPGLISSTFMPNAVYKKKSKLQSAVIDA